MVADGIQVCLLVLPQKLRAEVHAHVTARLKQRFQLIVGQVAEMIAQGAAAGMGGQRDEAQFQQIIKPAFAQVGGVRGNAHPGHFLCRLFPEGFQRRVLIHGSGGANAIFIIPGQRRHADA